MAGTRVGPLMLMAACSAGSVIGGCAAPGAMPPAPPQAAAAPKLPEPGSDWRALPVAPFGSRMQDLPFAVHEVLLFRDRDDADESAGAAERECYAPDGPARRFVGHDVQSYLLCFGHDRLERVEVSVELAATDAAADFSRYCDAWQPGTVVIRPRTAARCDGVQPHGLAFSAALGESADGETAPMSITVYEIPAPDGP